jgi:hypothetical protein
MKTLFIAVLAMALVGCAAAPQTEAPGVRKSTASKAGVKTAKPIAKKTKDVAKTKHVRTTGSVPAVPSKRSDPVTEKAKAAIAAMLDYPASAEFYGVQRAQKKLLQRPVDTICGRVRTKGASGKSKGGMPFLYIVGHDREDEAYLVTGNSHVAQTVHGALCK